ncbi:MAG TPA: hypothetical protein PKJ99_11905 [Thermoanaerobaculales bacterium]|mgnify:FL=1|nr:hypothetical protein [Thermoanaerobaculales bacterium]HPA79542.1 hypothetical protein [Thermoanaerobaculales bacterium]HQL31304.1 hypothetical protein [Thermoanaerobaculales bacterium]HQN95349.1 hypothetical protein [Thermoanaerobaculales bacterium]HQP42181.1 hypothetical protein [Thermoanaerobaculales bacterium]
MRHPGHGVQAAVAVAVLMGAAGHAAAQDGDPVRAPAQELAFDRPESWAMEWTASLTLITSLAPPTAREPGELALGLELDWIPTLSEDQRRVGFNGTKVEDFNRIDVLPRPRLAVGLGWATTLEFAYLPPVTIEGLRPNLFSAAVERPVVRAGDWIVGLRAYGQIGTVKGDITCPEREAGIPPGEPGNEFGCMGASDDEVTLEYLGLAVTAGWRIPGTGGSSLHAGVFATHMDLAFQVDAVTFGFHDQTRLEAEGWTTAVTAGVSFPLAASVRFAVEAFYTPLDVVRPPSPGVENDPLFNLRSLLTYEF